MKSPVSNADLVASPAPDERTLLKGMHDADHQAAYAARFVDQHLEKERELGVIHKDPTTGYITRVKDGR